MKFYATFRTLSQKTSLVLVFSIALSSVGTVYPQEWFKKQFTGAKEAAGKVAVQLGGAVAEKAKALASSAASKIQGGLSDAFNKVRSLDRSAIIGQLESQVESLGTKVGYMANCMAKGQCSSTDRATFIGVSVLVLALTAAAVGVTLTVAATSKEVEAITATTTQEVKGWAPGAIFQRLTNTINNFKQSLASLKAGILKRELTASQKKFLYGTALSIAALVTLAIGVGVGSYAYSEKQKGKREAKEAEEARRAEEAERAQKAHEAMVSLSEQAQKEQLGKAQIEEQVAKLLAELGTFDDNPTTQEELKKQSVFKQFFLSKIDVIKGAPNKLKEAFDLVVQKVKDGTIKTKEAAILAYEKAIDLANNLPSILDRALGVSIQKMNEGYNTVKGALDEFSTALSDPKQLLRGGYKWYPGTETLSSRLDELSNYLETLATMKEDAQQAWEKLNIFKIIHAKSLEPQEYLQKKQEFARKEAKYLSQQREISADLEKMKNLNPKEREKLQKNINERSKNVQSKLVKLAENRKNLRLKEQLDLFLSPKYWSERYFPGIVEKIQKLLLKSVGASTSAIMTALGKIFAGAEFLNKNGGVIGNRLFPNTAKIGQGLTALKEEFPKLGRNIQDLLSVEPIIQITEFKTSQIAKAAVKAFIEKKARFFREHRDKIKFIRGKLREIKGRIEPLQAKIEAFATWFKEFKPHIINEVKTTLFKDKNIARAAKLVRNAVITIVEKQKIAWNEVLDELPFITEAATQMVPEIGTVFVDLNTTLGGILSDKKPPINPEFINKLLPITGVRIPNIHRAIKDISDGTKNYAAPAA